MNERRFREKAAAIIQSLVDGAKNGETAEIRAWCRLTLDHHGFPEQWRDFSTVVDVVDDGEQPIRGNH